MDRDLINSKLDLVEENLALIEELQQEDFEGFKNSRRDVQAAKHSLQEAIAACIDIAYYLISAEGYRRPDNYRQAFRVLEEEGLFGPQFSEQLQDMAGFRNLLVHNYGEVDIERLYRILEEDAKDLRQFMAKIVQYLD